MRKLFAGVLVISMITLCFAIVPSITTANDAFIEDLAMLPLGFTPYEVAWNSDGTRALMVGTDTDSSGDCAYIYDPRTDTWIGLTYTFTSTDYALSACIWAEACYAGTGGWYAPSVGSYS